MLSSSRVGVQTVKFLDIHKSLYIYIYIYTVYDIKYACIYIFVSMSYVAFSIHFSNLLFFF